MDIIFSKTILLILMEIKFLKTGIFSVDLEEYRNRRV